MEIYIDIDNQEILASLENVKHSTELAKAWAVKVKGLGIVLNFTENDGFISNLRFSNTNITTNKTVLTERISEILNKVRQNENDGYEDTSESFSKEIETSENPYNPDEVKVRRDHYSIRELYTKIKEKGIDLNPDFQRHLVWDDTRKSRLIESILLGIPLPVFYFAEDKEEAFQVVDGLQRLSTIRDFMDNQFSLKNLEHLGQSCNGKYYKVSDKVNYDKVLEKRFERRIEKAQLNVNVIEASSPEKVKYDIFRRINEGGKPLNQQEIRNSLAKKQTRKVLKELVENPSFILATGNVSDTRMGAQEMVLRYIGFYLEKKQKIAYTGDMNDFLDKTNELVNKMTNEELESLKEIFLKSIQNCYHLFGQYCFRKYLPRQLTSGSKQLLNKSLFVTWTITMSDYNTEELKRISEFEFFSTILSNKLEEDKEYFRVVTTGTNDAKNLRYAFKTANELALKYFNS
jgi:uncharacterized protein with ParB-like and HNH nuclease domain